MTWAANVMQDHPWIGAAATRARLIMRQRTEAKDPLAFQIPGRDDAVVMCSINLMTVNLVMPTRTQVDLGRVDRTAREGQENRKH